MILSPTSVVYTLSLLSGVIFSVFGFGVKMGGVRLQLCCGPSVAILERLWSRHGLVFLRVLYTVPPTTGVDLIWGDLLWGWIGWAGIPVMVLRFALVIPHRCDSRSYGLAMVDDLVIVFL